MPRAIPGGYIKREGRPSEHGTLSARQIDRPIRPLFQEGFRNDVMIVTTVLSIGPRTRRRRPRVCAGRGGARRVRYSVRQERRCRARRPR